MFGMGSTEAVILLVLVLPGLLAANLASRQGRNRPIWFVIGALFPPSILLLLFLKPVREVKNIVRQCPACKEFVKWEAALCRYCRSAIKPVS